VFYGRETNRIDAKGRLAIPAKFREVVGQGARLVVTGKVFDPCLAVYTEERWRDLTDRLQSVSQVKPEVQRYRRLLFSAAEVCNLDRQGRILIPAHLRDHAGLAQEAVVVGTGETFEIWEPRRWREEASRDVDSGMAETLAGLGL
jgi:transcriptional regulator MraZ